MWWLRNQSPAFSLHGWKVSSRKNPRRTEGRIGGYVHKKSAVKRLWKNPVDNRVSVPLSCPRRHR